MSINISRYIAYCDFYYFRFGKEQSDSPSSVDNQNKYNFDTAVTKELFVHDQCTLYQTRHKTDHPSTSYQPFKSKIINFRCLLHESFCIVTCLKRLEFIYCFFGVMMFF